MKLKETFPNIPQTLVNEIENLVNKRGKTLNAACNAIINIYSIHPPLTPSKIISKIDELRSKRKSPSEAYDKIGKFFVTEQPCFMLMSEVDYRDLHDLLIDGRMPKFKSPDDPVKYINETIAHLLTCSHKLNNVFNGAISNGNILLADELIKNDWLNISTVFNWLKDRIRIDPFNENNIVIVKRILKYKDYIPNTKLDTAFKVVIEESNKEMLVFLINHHKEISKKDNKLTSSQKAALLSLAEHIGNDEITSPLHEAFDGTIDYSDLLESQGLITAASAVATDFLGWMHSANTSQSIDPATIGSKRKLADSSLNENSDDEATSSRKKI